MTILTEEEIDDIAQDWIIDVPTGFDLKWAIIISHRSLAAKNAELGKRVAELERTLKWEENRANRIGAHWPECHLSGPRHYECLLRKFTKANYTLK